MTCTHSDYTPSAQHDMYTHKGVLAYKEFNLRS